jgi:hypothetical protein
MITCRRQAEKEGNEQGKWSAGAFPHASRAEIKVAALDASEGRGQSAGAIPERWREVFKKAFFRAASRSVFSRKREQRLQASIEEMMR